MYVETTATSKITALIKRIKAIQGGTSASKTVSILLVLIGLAQSDYECGTCGVMGCQNRDHDETWEMKPTLTSVVSESMPHLKRGAIRDFLNIMKEHGYYQDARWNKSNFTYTFETGSEIEFFSGDQPDKLRGARRHRLYLNECNNVHFDVFEQLEVRTYDDVWLDWNPSSEFWFYTDVLGKRDDVDHITVTYLDNEALDEQTIKSIEQRKNRPEWWKVYGLGQLGEIEGRIYTGWDVIDEVPKEARLKAIGLDFGYTNDPSAAIAIYEYNGGLIFDEILYRKGMSNKAIADALATYSGTLVIGDSSEPKSIDEIKSYGVNIIGASKGPGSVNQGIAYIQDTHCSITKRSTNTLKEYRGYLWITDRNGKVLNTPQDFDNHCFAGDTLIETTFGLVAIQDLVGKSGYLVSRGNTIQRFSGVRPTRTDAETTILHFTDGTHLEVTPDHLLLQPDGIWQEAQLFTPMDVIQCAMYENNSVFQRQALQVTSWGAIFKSWYQAYASRSLGVSPWANSSKDARSSHRRECDKQFNRKPGAKNGTCSFVGTHDTRTPRASAATRRENTATYQEMARIKRGARVAQVTWQESYGKPTSTAENMQSLLHTVQYKVRKTVCKILWPELQNESPTKTIARISRGRQAVTYNLEVENTHCLVANGVIAHNSLDAIRYGAGKRMQGALIA